MFRTVCSHKVVAVGFNTLYYGAERCRGRRVLNPYTNKQCEFLHTQKYLNSCELPKSVTSHIFFYIYFIDKAIGVCYTDQSAKIMQ